MVIKERNKRIAVFASYSEDNRIADYVIYYLKALRKVVDGIIFVSDNEMEKGETDKLSGIVSKAICHRHGMYDFGSYRIGYFWALEHGLLDDATELIFANDSCYGPVFPFETVFDGMDKKSCDFWGLLDSYETAHHLLSFFLVFRKNVFTSKVFHNFVSGFIKQESFWDYVYLYERRFTELLENNRFRSAVYIDIDEETRGAFALRCGNGNLTLFPVSLYGWGMPLVKVKAMNGSFGVDLKESSCLLLQKIKAANPELYSVIKHDLDKRGVQQEDRWLTPEEIVGNAKVVSFDIFDTLLSRPYVKPTDLFLHMEEALGMVGFKEQRVRAERKARNRYKGQADVTLDQIYEELDEKYRSLKQEELRYERELLYPKADARSIYDEAVRQGKTIIAISDMYLPQEFLETVLKEKGYTEVSRVFVSNEENCCKGNGLLFQKVLDVLKVKPKDMVHVGDNYEADKEAPERLGIRACHRSSEVQNMFDNPAMMKYKVFAEDNPSLASSVLTGIYARCHAKTEPSNPFMELGYCLGGPLAVGYCQYIHKVARERGNDAILFVSRDGYALHKVYQKMFPDDIPSYYIYASRKLILRNYIDYKNESYFRNVCEIYTEECLQDTVVTHENIERHREQMEQWAATNAENYRKYIDSMHITGQKIMSVDMTTKSYTSLYMLRQVFGDRIDCGMFSISYGDPCDYTTFSYAERTWRMDDVPVLVMQEELITAPERSALSIDEHGNVIFSARNPIEDYRIDKYKEILKGVECFADDFIDVTFGRSVNLTFGLWLKLFHSYVGYSHFGDHELLKSIYHDDICQKTYETLYNVCTPQKKESVQQTIGIDNGTLYRKNMKHLKAIRKLVIALCVAVAAIISLLIMLLGN